MALDTFVAGPYSGTYNAVDVGISENGYELQQESAVQDIAPSDLYGDSVIDSVYRGGNVFMQFEGKAYKAGVITPFWPWAALGVMGTVGRLASNVAAAQVLTAKAGTSAAASPATLTSTLAMLAANFPARLLYSSVLRTVPVRLRVYPYDSGSGVIKWFTMT